MTDQSVDNKNIENTKIILVGIISKAHGIKGHVVVKSYTFPVENIVYLPVFDQNKNPIQLKTIRIQPNGNLVCSIKNCNDRTIAEQMVKKPLYCFRQDLPKIIEDDEYYIEDLIGLKVLSNNGTHIGQIINLANYGGGDVVEIKFVNKKESEILPFTKDFFPEIYSDYIIYKNY